MKTYAYELSYNIDLDTFCKVVDYCLLKKWKLEFVDGSKQIMILLLTEEDACMLNLMFPCNLRKKTNDAE